MTVSTTIYVPVFQPMSLRWSECRRLLHRPFDLLCSKGGKLRLGTTRTFVKLLGVFSPSMLFSVLISSIQATKTHSLLTMSPPFDVWISQSPQLYCDFPTKRKCIPSLRSLSGAREMFLRLVVQGFLQVLSLPFK